MIPVPVPGVILFVGCFFVAGTGLGFGLRSLPPLFGFMHEPARGWLYALVVGITTVIFYETHVLESWVVYGLALREGLWLPVWFICGAYGVAVGYSGRLFPRSEIRVRKWHTGQRDTDIQAERRNSGEKENL